MKTPNHGPRIQTYLRDGQAGLWSRRVQRARYSSVTRLGNQIFGSWVRWTRYRGEQYAQAAVRYARAMRAVDPALQLIAVGEGIYPGNDVWNSAVLETAGGEIQYLAVHNYTSITQNANQPNPRAAMMAQAGEFEANDRHMGNLIVKKAPGLNIKLIVNEWNLFYDADEIESIEGAVYA